MSLYRFKIGEGALIKLFYTTTDLTQYVPTQVTPRIPISITGYGTSTVPQNGDLVVDDYGTFAVVTGEVTVSDNVPQAYVKIISHVAQGVYKISNQALNATVGGTYSIDDANISPSSRLVQKGDVAVDENGRVGVFQDDYDGTGRNVITTIYAAGVYQKPSGGIPKTDLAQAVQNSLDKAESALQSVTKNDVGLGNVDNVKQYSASNPPPYPVTSVNNKTGAVSLSKSDVGLGNVDNVKQYSASNPPPYPVTSVNGQTGAVSLSAADDVEILSGLAFDPGFGQTSGNIVGYRIGKLVVITVVFTPGSSGIAWRDWALAEGIPMPANSNSDPIPQYVGTCIPETPCALSNDNINDVQFNLRAYKGSSRLWIHRCTNTNGAAVGAGVQFRGTIVYICQ